jgi:benzylsuccinate CoA-transferase BbsE subunit
MKNQGALDLLDRYRVLDITDEKGFLCGKILGDLGADVIKIEKPGGDASRNIGPFYGNNPDPQQSLYWFAYNTSKRGITLNLESPDGKPIFERLIEKADFIIESFRPGYLDTLNLGYTDLRKVNSRLIMTAISPFGQTGVYKDYLGSDLVLSAMGGLSYLCGEENGPPLRISGVGQSYLQAGAQAAVATLMAHYSRLASGEGTYIDISIQECMCWTTELAVPVWVENKEVFRRRGINQKRGGAKYRRIFKCKDGYVTYAIQTGRMAGAMHSRLVKLMDEHGMAGDMRDVDWTKLSMADISENIPHWEDLLDNFFEKYTKAEIQRMATEKQLIACPVNNVEDISKYAQLETRDYWKVISHPELNTEIKYPGFWFKTDKGSCGIRSRAPLVGEHNSEIYQGELGLSNEEFNRLKKSGVI